jgi:putative transposase
MLEEKATRYGRTFAKVDRWFPSSQLCSACGIKDGPKPLSVRTWTCPECGTVHDRDLNAARNILLEGRKTAAGRAALPVEGAEDLASVRRHPTKQEPTGAPHDAAQEESPA